MFWIPNPVQKKKNNPRPDSSQRGSLRALAGAGMSEPKPRAGMFSSESHDIGLATIYKTQNILLRIILSLTSNTIPRLLLLPPPPHLLLLTLIAAHPGIHAHPRCLLIYAGMALSSAV